MMRWAGQAFAASILTVMLIVVYPYAARLFTSPNDYFRIEQIRIDDMRAGTDGRVWYGKAVQQPFHGQWKAQIYQIAGETKTPVCAGPPGGIGVGYYSNENGKGGPVYVTLRWYMGDPPCLDRLTTGVYIVETIWTTPGGNLTAWSNRFTIF